MKISYDKGFVVLFMMLTTMMIMVTMLMMIEMVEVVAKA